MDPSDDPHLDVCEEIEAGLKSAYETHPELTDALCVFALENAVIASKQKFGFAKKEKISDHPLLGGIIQGCVAVGMARIGTVNDLTLKEFVIQIEKIKRSVIRHSAFGSRGYYDFIKKYV